MRISTNEIEIAPPVLGSVTVQDGLPGCRDTPCWSKNHSFRAEVLGPRP